MAYSDGSGFWSKMGEIDEKLTKSRENILKMIAHFLTIAVDFEDQDRLHDLHEGIKTLLDHAQGCIEKGEKLPYNEDWFEEFI